MFCALKGATCTPRRASARHRPVVTTLLPASLVVPATRDPAISGLSRTRRTGTDPSPSRPRPWPRPGSRRCRAARLPPDRVTSRSPAAPRLAPHQIVQSSRPVRSTRSGGGLSMATMLSCPAATASCSRRPVVTCTGRPTSCSTMRCRAASSCGALMPGRTSKSSATPSMRRISRSSRRRGWSSRTATGPPTPGTPPCRRAPAAPRRTPRRARRASRRRRLGNRGLPSPGERSRSGSRTATISTAVGSVGPHDLAPQREQPVVSRSAPLSAASTKSTGAQRVGDLGGDLSWAPSRRRGSGPCTGVARSPVLQVAFDLEVRLLQGGQGLRIRLGPQTAVGRLLQPLHDAVQGPRIARCAGTRCVSGSRTYSWASFSYIQSCTTPAVASKPKR